MTNKKYNYLKFILSIFFTWKIWTLVFSSFAVVFINLKLNFLGGGLEHYLRFPWFWLWANFDGEHYLAIAQHGYGNGEQAFFPLYSLLMQWLSWPMRGDIYFLQLVGLLISYISFFIALIGLWKIINLDFKEKIAKLTIILLIVFPTSFYFGSTYTESLFFSLTIWSFYSARRGKWWLAGILGALASTSRFIGILLLPVLLIEWWIQKKKFTIYNLQFLSIFLVPFGLFSYMYYLKQTTGDPLAFLHSLSYFGEQRSITPILLPQVFWRYLKIMMDIPKNDPFFFTFLLEVSTAILFLILSIFSFFKLRLSYAVWLLLGYLVPTFSGSFSSLPRYILPLFPAFLLMAMFLEKQPQKIQIVIALFLMTLLSISTILFARGYWIA
ncbi:hypothetical protein HY404_01140 [Candidatus Microgenomates bacterium]|nr:hypothetical protein [Candidatus Microgenomates bacterium]